VRETRHLDGRRLCALSLCLALVSGSDAQSQDSVAATPGGNDALSAQEDQRVRYAIEMSPVASSWGLNWAVAPILKASRSEDPLFNTNLAAAAVASADLLPSVSPGPTSFATWSGPGFGVNPTENLSPQTVERGSFNWQFGLALNDLDLTGTNVITAIVRQRLAEGNRLFVERVVSGTSRATPAGDETSTLSLGAVGASGATHIRGDAFNVDSGPLANLRLDNIIRVDAAARDEGIINTFMAVLGSNVAADDAATTFCLSKQSLTLNTPAAQPGSVTNDGEQKMLSLAFDGSFRGGEQPPTLGHLDATVLASRGNPSFSALAPIDQSSGTAACLGVTTSSGAIRTDALNAWALSNDAGVVGQPVSAVLPSALSDGSFMASDAEFHQWRSQTSFRGGNGPVGIGTTPAGDLLLAATARSDTGDEFIAVADFTGGAPMWSIAAFPEKPVLNGQDGAQIGRIVHGATIMPGSAATFSAPAIDRFGNLYFVATWKPNLGAGGTGLFRAVRTPSGYQLELLLRSGQILVGASSQTPYEIVRLILDDSDSIASGAFWSGSLLQTQTVATQDADSPLAIGGLVVNAVIRYDNAAQEEEYDATLFVQGRVDPQISADIDGDGEVGSSDLALLLGAWGTGSAAADLDGDGEIGSTDLALLLGSWGPVP